jgi:hypothetical protein
MMVEKESGKLWDTEFPSVWTEDPSVVGDARYVWCLAVEAPQLDISAKCMIWNWTI